MSRNHVDHRDLLNFAQNEVNLPKSKADKYRAQAERLSQKLENHLENHPDFSLKKLMISGSLAKGTALRTLNDIDLACYVSSTDAPSDILELLKYIADKLETAFPNLSPDQVQPKTYSITVSFKGTGLDVDVVPILYDTNSSNWYGNLISQDDGSFLKTSIPLHLDFIAKRKRKHDKHFSQVVRLVKFWARKEKREREGFRFKSFMIEMILSKLSDQGVTFSDYPEALQSFFTYIATSNISELIVFTDYYSPNKVPQQTARVKIIDPVNPDNNVGENYTATQADMIVDAALEAGDAIDAALRATTKKDTVYYWQKLFGQTFQV